MSQRWEPTPGCCHKISKLRYYDGPIDEIGYADTVWFESKYHIDPPIAKAHIKYGNYGRYALPVRDPSGLERGYVLRKPWNGAPRTFNSSYAWLPKADTFMSKKAPVQSWYLYGDKTLPLILVEDQLSAIKLYNHGYNAVALLGTPYSGDQRGFQQADRIAELSQESGDNGIIVALDADATNDAFLFVRKWGYAFRQARVAILERDLKDTVPGDFGRILGV